MHTSHSALAIRFLAIGRCVALSAIVCVVTRADDTASSSSYLTYLNAHSDPNVRNAASFQLLESAIDPSQANSPAALSYNHSVTAGSYVVADLGLQVGYRFGPTETTHGSNSQWTTYLAGIVEIHHDPLKANLENSQQYGATLNGFWGWPQEANPSSAAAKTPDEPKVTGLFWATTFTYKDDTVKTGKAITGSLGVSPITSVLPINEEPRNSKFLISPWLYLQEEDTNPIKTTDKTGSVARVEGAFTVSYYPLVSLAKNDKSVEVIVTEDVWYNLSRSGTYKQFNVDQSYFGTNVNYYFDSKHNFSIGASYTNGQNPQLSKFPARVFTVQIKVKFGGSTSSK